MTLLRVLAVAALSLHLASANIIDADPKTFGDVVGASSTISLVGFFAPWCGHCKSLKPTWEKLAELYAEEPGVQIVSVDADAHRELGEKYEVRGFPTLKLFKNAKDTPEDYGGGRRLEDFVQYLNEKADSDVTPDGSGSSKMGLIPDVHPLLAGFADASPDEQVEMLEQAKAVADENENAQDQWGVYAKVAGRVMTDGADYLETELARLTSILSKGASLTNVQKKKFMRKVNVLRVFSDEL